MSTVDFFSDVSNIIKGNYALFPRFTLMRMVGRGRRAEHVQKHIADTAKKIIEAENKGSVHDVKKEETELVKEIIKEEKAEEYEVEAEEKLDMKLVRDLENIIKAMKGSKALKDDKEARTSVKAAIDQIAALTKLQIADLGQVKEGGTRIRTSSIHLDMGQCTNTAIQRARDMRGEIGKVIGLIRDAADKCRDFDKEKKPEDAKKELVEKLKVLNAELKKFLQYMDDHFLMMLRLFRFLVDEIKQEDEHTKHMQEEGLSEKTVKELHKELHKALDSFHKRVEEESEHAQRIIQQEERELAEI